jgi:hypothetical protein
MFPFTGLRLLLPALVPSWRFFDAVSASPRVEYALLADPDDQADGWQEFRPRPAVLTLGTMLRRLFWNPEWNESLFLVSCAERLTSATSAHTENHSERELMLRVARDLHCHALADPSGWLQIRLRFVSRDGPMDEVGSRIVYLSTPRALAGLMTS